MQKYFILNIDHLVQLFTLKDLVDDDVMVLDSGLEIYVWVGLHATDQEREAGFNMAQVCLMVILFFCHSYNSLFAGILAH